ncbi:YebC/PmpR family DNA-binding transcriptional regulator [Flavobacteriales bacterium]|nr:YebC/PmpR family DNA-binding transcriptional regulator [Flavobacteriales bacterium]
MSMEKCKLFWIKKKWVVNNSELQRVPVDTTTLDLESAQKVMKLIDRMEEDDDVNAVYHNLEITEELINAI